MSNDSSASKPITIITVFNVAPENQQRLIDLLANSARTLIPRAPGFRSSRLHRSLDGTKVAAYTQWRSLTDYQAVRDNAAAAPYVEQILALATIEPGIYEVVETFIGST